MSEHPAVNMRNDNCRRGNADEAPLFHFRFPLQQHIVIMPVAVTGAKHGRRVFSPQAVKQTGNLRQSSAINRQTEDNQIVGGKPMMLPAGGRQSEINRNKRSFHGAAHQFGCTRRSSGRAEKQAVIHFFSLSFRLFCRCRRAKNKRRKSVLSGKISAVLLYRCPIPRRQRLFWLPYKPKSVSFYRRSRRRR